MNYFVSSWTRISQEQYHFRYVFKVSDTNWLEMRFTMSNIFMP